MPAYTQPRTASSSDAVAADADDLLFGPEELPLVPASWEELDGANKLPVVTVPGCDLQNIDESPWADFDASCDPVREADGSNISDALKTDSKPLA